MKANLKRVLLAGMAMLVLPALLVAPAGAARSVIHDPNDAATGYLDVLMTELTEQSGADTLTFTMTLEAPVPAEPSELFLMWAWPLDVDERLSQGPGAGVNEYAVAVRWQAGAFEAVLVDRSVLPFHETPIPFTVDGLIVRAFIEPSLIVNATSFDWHAITRISPFQTMSPGSTTDRAPDAGFATWSRGPAFQRTWQRTDKPVADLLVSRTWVWGPEPFTGVIQEDYSDAPGGARSVQYYDKARMEDNSYRADGPPWDVTNGLLVVELVSGQLQTGDHQFVTRQPADINVAGDPDDPTGPTYATFGELLDEAPIPPSWHIIQTIDRAGAIGSDPSLGSYEVRAVDVGAPTNHAVASPFWTFMTSSGLVYENGQNVEEPLFENPFYATGYPITEAYWAEVKVGGVHKDVLIQCFERRCLTWTPSNPAGWQVEAGNVGQHYYRWRHEEP